MLGFFTVDESKKEACKAVLFELSRHLVRCVETSDRICAEIDAGKASLASAGLTTQSSGRVVNLPGVADLPSHAEGFLQSAKLAVRETARLVEPFYGGKHDHRYHKLHAWSKEKFGADNLLTGTTEAWEPWVAELVTMRNAVDHPKDEARGKLVVRNFRLDTDVSPPIVLDPVWYLTDEPERKIAEDMKSYIEGIIRLGEDLLVAMFHHFHPQLPLVIYEIPEHERDPSMPKRLRVGLANER